MIPALLILSFACAPSYRSVQGLGESTVALSDAAMGTYGAIDEAWQTSAFYLMLSAPELPALDAERLASPLTAERLAARQTALSALSAYGAGLAALSVAEDPAAAEAAVLSLHASLLGVGASLRANNIGVGQAEISDEALRAGFVALEGARRLAVAKLKREGLRAAITAADPGVQGLTALLMDELNPQGELCVSGAEQWRAAAGSYRLAHVDDPSNLGRPEAWSNRSWIGRAELLAGIDGLVARGPAVISACAELSAAASSFGKAHGALAQGVASKRLNLDAAAEAVAQLSADAQALQSLYQNFPTRE